VNQTIVLRFVNINRFGNNIYLDNINIGEQGVKALLSAENTCVNENVVFTSNSIGNIDTYQWEFGADANPNSASGVGPHIVTYSSIGTKQVSLTVEGVNGTDSDIFPVIIANEPQAEFSYTSNNLSVSFETQEIALSYLWDFGDGETSNLQNPTHQYNQSGIYQVSLTVENECGESEKVETITVETIGLNAITSENGFKIFPNPGSDLFYIELPETNSDLYLSLTDLSGRIVFNTMYPKNTPLASINTSLLPRGMYLVKVYNKEVSSVLRWLKIDD
jgi:PKD repeat protein